MILPINCLYLPRLYSTYMTITTLIIIVTSFFSVIAFQGNSLLPENLRRPEWTDKYKFNAYLIWHERQFVRLFGHGLIHANLMHLVFNMITLYCFGEGLEILFSAYSGSTLIGKLLFLLLYVTALPVSSLWDLFRHRDHSYYNAVGASGAVSAVLFSVIVFIPDVPIYFMFIPVPIPGWIFAILYLVFCIYMDRKGIDNIGHSAHFMGSIYGLVFTLLTKLILV